MKIEDRLISALPLWLYENYGFHCVDCKLILSGINYVFSALTKNGGVFFVKIFQSERSHSSVEAEGNISNRLLTYSISATEVVRNIGGAMASFISVSGQKRSVLVFVKAIGRECTLSHRDLSLCADTLFRLHNLVPPDVSIPFFDINREYTKMNEVSDLSLHYSELKEHYIRMLRVMKVQDFHHGLSVCHGDPRYRNIFISNNNAAFIDFEYCCISSPCLDLGIMIWNLQTGGTDTSKADFFLDCYNRHSEYKFEFKELAPYILVHEIWSVWFLIRYHLLTPHLTRPVMRDSSAMFTMLKPYLRSCDEY